MKKSKQSVNLFYNSSNFLSLLHLTYAMRKRHFDQYLYPDFLDCNNSCRVLWHLLHSNIEFPHEGQNISCLSMRSKSVNNSTLFCTSSGLSCFKIVSAASFFVCVFSFDADFLVNFGDACFAFTQPLLVVFACFFQYFFSSFKSSG